MNVMATIKIKIDGKTISVRSGTNLLEMAHQNNIPIPSLCYHHKLTPTGACRLCITKIKGMNGLVAACTVTVSNGMEVTAFDEELEDTRRYLLDYLLSEHNEASDLSYDDEFKALVARYGLEDASKRQFPSLWKSLDYPIDDSSPVLTYDASKCIKCFRCIKACDEVQGKVFCPLPIAASHHMSLGGSASGGNRNVMVVVNAFSFVPPER